MHKKAVPAMIGRHHNADQGGTANVHKEAAFEAEGEIIASGDERVSHAGRFQASPIGCFAEEDSAMGYPSAGLRLASFNLVRWRQCGGEV